jgi:hypothetical protein
LRCRDFSFQCRLAAKNGAIQHDTNRLCSNSVYSGELLVMRNFSGTEFANRAAGFDSPAQLPRDEIQHRRWQSANKAWWEDTPMRYDWRDGIAEVPGTKAYFREIDRRFLSSARKYMPWRSVPFEEVIPFHELSDEDVLEIGVGLGTHAQLLAPRCKSFTGIDLTSSAAEWRL